MLVNFLSQFYHFLALLVDLVGLQSDDLQVMIHGLKSRKSDLFSKVINDLPKDSYSLFPALTPLIPDGLHILQGQLEIKFFKDACKLDLGSLHDLQSFIVVNQS